MHARLTLSTAVLVLAAACSRPATQSVATAPSPATVAAPGTTATTAVATPVPAPIAGPASQTTLAAGYSCTFPGPAGRPILARFTVDGATAHDDQGLAFAVLTNSPTALVLAHARDDLATAPAGDVGAYVVAVDRRTLGMVQSSVGLHGAGATRHGRCIAG